MSSEVGRSVLVCLIALGVVLGAGAGFAAADRYGQISFTGLPVPGATITATQGDKRFVTHSNEQGIYRLDDLADGVWMIRIEMVGFSTISREVTLAPDSEPTSWELTLLPFDEIARNTRLETQNQPAAPSSQPSNTSAGSATTAPSAIAATGTGPAPASAPAGFQRAGVNPSVLAPPAAGTAPAVPDESPASPSGLGGADDGFLINGSVNNSAASPFAQPAAFGNNRPGARSLYNGGVGAILGNSAWDARPFSFTGQPAPKADYTDMQFLGTFGGPLRIPRLIRNGGTLFVGYQRIVDHNATTQSGLMPTLLERDGDFSQSVDGFGRPVQIVDPTTGLPFVGNVIPKERITQQAAALLGYYPAPSVDAADASGRYNYERPVLTALHQDSVQARLSRTIFTRNQLFGNFSYQRTKTDTTSLFGFVDSTTITALDTAANWSRRVSMFLTLRLRYQFTRLATDVSPYFANRINVSGEAGIAGNNQEPVNWGPPRLTFSSGVAGLSSAHYASNRTLTNAGNAEALWARGRHYFTIGGDVRGQRLNVLAQLDARGGFSFSGSASGSDLADFLLGIPQSSAIAFGNADKYLRSSTYAAYINDDWRVSPSLTMTVGIRWEHETPITERFGRLANLDVAPDFSTISAVAATDPIGSVTGQRYPASLLHPDRLGFQPRIGVAWRPVPGSSLVIRGGYGIYRNTSVYQSIAQLLAQQPPFSQTSSVENSADHPLTLANGFVVPSGAVSNTFAVDPNFRVGLAHNWQISAQRDLPASLTFIATYLGTHGSRLQQEFLPNTYPLGAVNPCPSCPAGFVYLTSNGSSSRHAGQVQLRRRLRNGLTATMQYTLSKAVDDAAAFSGAGLSGASIAQDWLNLDAERGPSNFDQLHLLTAQFQYTTGIGVAGGALLSGMKGSLIKGWTVTMQLTTGSGLPLTPVYLTSVAGTGVTGTIRADTTGAPNASLPDGFYLNPASYTIPAPGRWGNAGRNSVVGPPQFSLNAGIARTFPFGNRLNLDWRIDAVNVLNRVTFSSVNTLVGSPQFGQPDRANQMRKIQSTLRLRF